MKNIIDKSCTTCVHHYPSVSCVNCGSKYINYLQGEDIVGQNVLVKCHLQDEDELVRKMIAFVTENDMSINKFDRIYRLAKAQLYDGLFQFDSVEK